MVLHVVSKCPLSWRCCFQCKILPEDRCEHVGEDCEDDDEKEDEDEDTGKNTFDILEHWNIFQILSKVRTKCHKESSIGGSEIAS